LAVQVEHLEQSAGGSVRSAALGCVHRFFDHFLGRALASSLSMVGGINQCPGHN